MSAEEKKIEKKEENKQRAERLRQELIKVTGKTSGLVNYICHTANIPLGTARGYYYRGIAPHLSHAKDIAKALGIDYLYWTFGVRAQIDAKRLEQSWHLFAEIASKYKDIELTHYQVAFAVALIYNDREPVQEKALQQVKDHFKFASMAQ